MTEKNILIPIDFTEVNKPLVRMADTWAQRTGAKLYFLHVVSDLTYRFIDTSIQNVFHTNDEKIKEVIWKHMESFIAEQQVTAPHTCLIREGKAYREIVKVQKELDIDLIIIAAHDHTVVDRFFIGSNTDYVLHHVHCPVFVYKAEVTPAAA
ncbi:MAG: universal stress protein [Verrucomicrobiae bacterium]|nr:universal stress protein [Verrucomicrobiae bacterium]